MTRKICSVQHSPRYASIHSAGRLNGRTRRRREGDVVVEIESVRDVVAFTYTVAHKSEVMMALRVSNM